MNDQPAVQPTDKRLRDALSEARRFASQVTLRVFSKRNSEDLQEQGNALIDLIDEALDGGEAT